LQQSSKDEELLRSVKGGLTPRVRHLLQTGADIDCQDDTGLSALHIAVATGFEDVVDLLLQKGADINALHPTAGTPLCLATNKERSHIIRKLIAARADINRASHQGATPLHWASFHGDVGLLTSLLSSVARPLAVVDVRCMDGETPATTKTCPRKYARSPLGLAAERGYVECTRILCQYGGVDSNAYQHGLGPLFYACLKAHPECVDLLLQQGVDPNERVFLDDGRADSLSSTYVILFAMLRLQAQGSILYSLIDAKARTDVRGGDGTSIARTILCYHREPRGHRRVMSFLPADPTGKFSCIAFADKVKRVMELARAASLSFSLRRDLAVFEKHVVFTAASTSANHLSDLLDLGADIDVTDYTGSTALHLAVTVGNSEATELLLGKGARSDVYHDIERAPLWEAVSKRDYEAVELLLSHGANPNIVNSEGRTLLHLVASQGVVELIGVLVKAGTSVSARDNWSRTPLYLAEDKPTAEALIELGAHPSTRRDKPVRSFKKTREDVARVLVLGRTGSGKTAFINALTRSNYRTRTNGIAIVQSYLDGYRTEVDVIDAPGWGGLRNTDYGVLKLIQGFLGEEYRTGRRLNCVVYMIHSGDSRFDDPHSRWIKILEELVGSEAYQNVNFVFTHGLPESGEDQDANLDLQRQEESKRIDAWKQILQPEAKNWRFTLSGKPGSDDLEEKSGK
jgi:ankyrin repeat protein/GTPase SAR1 family protein